METAFREVTGGARMTEITELIEEVKEDHKRYYEAYNILMEYWDSLPEEEKPYIDRRLKELGL